MLYFADTANARSVAELMEFYPIDGVTTNPTIVSREKGDFCEMMLALRKTIGNDRMLHIQTTQTCAEMMVKEALALKEFVGGCFYVKIPLTPDGLKASSVLAQQGVNVTMTAVFSAPQAMLAAKCGAKFVAPYVNKLDDLCGDGAKVVADIAEQMKVNHCDTRILAASFRNANQVDDVMRAGTQAITVPPTFFHNMVWHPLTDIALKGFAENWSCVYGDKTPLDMISERR